jgi:hypothetical protein
MTSVTIEYNEGAASQRLLAGAWSIHGGEYRIALAHSAANEAASASAQLTAHN